MLVNVDASAGNPSTPAKGSGGLVHRVRMAHRQFPTGVTVVTVMAAGGEPAGLTVNAFTSLSLDPPQILVCVARTSATHAHLVVGANAAVNILGHDQEDVARAFARTAGAKFDGLSWAHGRFGAPVLAGTAAVIESRLRDVIENPTHSVLIGTVMHAEVSSRAPLIYLGGQFFDSRRIRDDLGPGAEGC